MKTAMIVEDSRFMQRVLKETLSLIGELQVVNITDDGRKAIELLVREEHPDLIVVDLALPSMDGGEFVMHIRSVFSGKILVVTGFEPEAPEIEDVLSRGADAVVCKPNASDPNYTADCWQNELDAAVRDLLFML